MIERYKSIYPLKESVAYKLVAKKAGKPIFRDSLMLQDPFKNKSILYIFWKLVANKEEDTFTLYNTLSLAGGPNQTIPFSLNNLQTQLPENVELTLTEEEADAFVAILQKGNTAAVDKWLYKQLKYNYTDKVITAVNRGVERVISSPKPTILL